MTTFDDRVEALTNAVYVLRGYDDYDMADALHAAEWLRSGRQPFDDDEPIAQRPILDEVYSWSSRPAANTGTAMHPAAERRNDPMPAEEMRNQVSGSVYLTLRRKLAEALGKEDAGYLDAQLIAAVWDMRDHRSRLEEGQHYDVAHFDATVQEYRRELDQANRTIAALQPQLALAEKLYEAARAVVRAEDLQGSDDVVTYLRILVEQADAAGWDPDDADAA